MEHTCREILDSLRTYLDGEQPGDLDGVIAEHLEACPPCLERADFERELKALIARTCRDEAPPGLADSVIARLGRP